MLPLRKVAAELDLDPSTLGKIEKNTRSPSKEHVQKLSILFGLAEKELQIQLLSDRIAKDIAELDYSDQIMEITAFKIRQVKTKQS